MTEDERIELVTQLGLRNEDVMVLDAEHNTPAAFHMLVVEDSRIIHVATGWGEIVVERFERNDDETLALLDGTTILDVGGRLESIPHK